MDLNKKILTLCFVFGILQVCKAQLNNNGIVTVSSGTVVSTFDDLNNASSGVFNNNGELYVYGDLKNDGVFAYQTNAANGITYFQGTTSQEIMGNSPITFYDVVFNNSSSASPFVLSGSINLINKAQFLKGVVQNEGHGGSFVFQTSASHTSTSDISHVQGPVKKNGSSAFIYPVGSSGFYRGNAISASGDASMFTSEYFLENSNNLYPHNAVEGNIGFINDSEYWVLEREQGSGSVSFTAGLNSVTTPEEILNANTSEIHLVKWDDVKKSWIDQGGVFTQSDGEIKTEDFITNGTLTLALVSSDMTDTDEDGVPDFVENNALPPTDPTNPNDYPDTDGDGVPDYVENNASPKTDPNDTDDFDDEDGDGIPDYVEDFGIDTDGDGVPDYTELEGNPSTDPNDPNDFMDSDGDGVPDYVETNSEPTSDPGDGSDYTDSDGDGVPDYVETNGDPASDPENADDYIDSDGDGVPDYVEINSTPASDPENADDYIDSDGDGVPDYVETHDDSASDPEDSSNFADSDGDGVPDYTEINGNPATNPYDRTDFTDSDGDGVPDYVEVNGEPSSDPNDPSDFADSDGDGITDYTEDNYVKDEIFIENDLVSKSVADGYFEIVNIERFPDNSVEIFNRNGLLVFSVDGYDNNSRVFRGYSEGKATIQKGEGLPTGVYFYIINYVNEDKNQSKTGYLYIQQ